MKENKDYCGYVNVFQGSGETDLPKPEGIAAKWFFIKAQCGNTSPAAVGPFGAMSVVPFTGGYPTGSGDHCVNTHGKVRHFGDGRLFKGFSHLNQSGTGAMGYYYNFLLTSPLTPGRSGGYAVLSESAEPGYYSCALDGGVLCEATALGKAGCHRYTFPTEGCRVVTDFARQGLSLPEGSSETAPPAQVLSAKSVNGAVLVTILSYGVKLHFAVSSDGETALRGDLAEFIPDGKTLRIKIAVSTLSPEKALESLLAAPDFDGMKAASRAAWNDALSRIDVDADEKTLEIFYSNLYHSLVKPCDLDGESFYYAAGKPFVADLATLWDMYKTQLPLVFLAYPEMGQKVCETLLLTCEKLGFIPNSIGLNSDFAAHSAQARLLGDYALVTAYRYGLDMDADRLLDAVEKDVFDEAKSDFTRDGRCASESWTLDMADLCALARDLARERGRLSLADRLAPLAERWRAAFDEKTGLLTADSRYYEGSLYTYSFRPMADIAGRIALAGGKERFTELLDSFFGYGRTDALQATDPADREYMSRMFAEGRFDGTNNEADMETPYSYIFAGRHDRTCEIINACLKYMYSTGRGGLPGNSDTGALTSWYCFSALGVFPVAGQDLFLLGAPAVDSAVIKLSGGATLHITVKNRSPENAYVAGAVLDGEPLADFTVPAGRLMRGGTLTFIMKDGTENQRTETA